MPGSGLTTLLTTYLIPRSDCWFTPRNAGFVISGREIAKLAKSLAIVPILLGSKKLRHSRGMQLHLRHFGIDRDHFSICFN